MKLELQIVGQPSPCSHVADQGGTWGKRADRDATGRQLHVMKWVFLRDPGGIALAKSKRARIVRPNGTESTMKNRTIGDPRQLKRSRGATINLGGRIDSLKKLLCGGPLPH